MKKQTKKRKTKKKNNKNITRIIIILVLLLAVITGIYFFLNAEDDNSKLTLFDKQWIDKNKSTLFNIEIPNNINIYGKNGEGVLFNYIKYLENETKLTFNKISYNYPSKNEEESGLKIMILSNSDTLKKDDILISEDKYVLVSPTNTNIDDLSIITNKKIGILQTDKEIFNNTYNINYQTYNNLGDLLKAVKQKKLDYAVIPQHYSLEETVKNNLYINYIYTDISNKIVLRMSTNKKLNDIVAKNIEKYKEEKLRTNYDEQLMNFYVSNMNIKDVDQQSLSNKTYKYGYVKTNAYNISNNKKIYSVAGEYINTLKNMTNIDINYIPFDNKEKLKKAIEKNEIDFAFIDFEYENEQGYKTPSNIDTTFLALSKNYKNIDNKKGLTNNRLYVYTDNNLYTYINNNYNANITKTNNENVPLNEILLIDETDYLLKRNELNDTYNIIFKDTYPSGNHFNINENEKNLSDILTFITNYIDNKNIKELGMNTIIENDEDNKNFSTLYLAILSIILLPIILIITVVIINKITFKFKNPKKEDVLKYNDMLTSLKNRNYLNANIDTWDETKIYPRTIIMLDLNNLKYVNDNYGHQEGNELIKRAAAVLINTQLEKSEIIRTDGNEFLVYLIGYNEKQIKTYIGKLSKEFEKLPHGFGVSTGYSMIEDEIKTIDDAINEASIAMRKDKQERFK